MVWGMLREHFGGSRGRTRRAFGTDGVRGTANIEPMTPETALKVAMAVGECFRNGTHKHLVVIGKDTRLSGYMLEPALTAGFITMGMDVVLVGPLPTPAIAMLTRSLRADIGVVISASHNPYADNGIKLFGRDGYKLSDELEAKIEASLEKGPSHRAGPARWAAPSGSTDAGGRAYRVRYKQSFPKGLRLDGMRVVVDCAHGAAYKVAPTVFWELGAEVFSVGVSPDGMNINRDCGALSPEQMRQEVLARRADIDIALDGDADRLIVVDERGIILDGDQGMALITTSLANAKQLAGGALVATVMSNLGLERYLGEQGIGLHRTSVGDRYVVEKMRSTGCNVGGGVAARATSSSPTTRRPVTASSPRCRSWAASSRPARRRARFAAFSRRCRNCCATCVSARAGRWSRAASSRRSPPAKRGSAMRAGSSFAPRAPSR